MDEELIDVNATHSKSKENHLILQGDSALDISTQCDGKLCAVGNDLKDFATVIFETDEDNVNEHSPIVLDSSARSDKDLTVNKSESLHLILYEAFH